MDDDEPAETASAPAPSNTTPPVPRRASSIKFTGLAAATSTAVPSKGRSSIDLGSNRASLDVSPANRRVSTSGNMRHSFLQSVPLLEGLAEEQIPRLVCRLVEQIHKPGDYIVKIGETADSMYFIMEGEVSCHKGGDELMRLKEGSFFGESCLEGDQANRTLRKCAAAAAK